GRDEPAGRVGREPRRAGAPHGGPPARAVGHRRRPDDRRARARARRAVRPSPRAAAAGGDRPAGRRRRPAEERDGGAAGRPGAPLERMGDLARHIAQVARGRYPAHAVVPTLHRTFEQMHDAAVRVARRTTTLLTTRDLTVAANVQRDDDLLDSLHQDTFTALLDGTWSGTPQETVDVTLVGRYYERFGDHGVSIAKRVTYLVTGDFADDRGAPAGSARATA